MWFHASAPECDCSSCLFATMGEEEEEEVVVLRWWCCCWCVLTFCLVRRQSRDAVVSLCLLFLFSFVWFVGGLVGPRLQTQRGMMGNGGGWHLGGQVCLNWRFFWYARYQQHIQRPLPVFRGTNRDPCLAAAKHSGSSAAEPRVFRTDVWLASGLFLFIPPL